MLIKAKIKKMVENALLYIMGITPLGITLSVVVYDMIEIVNSGSKPDIRWAIGSFVAMLLSTVVLIVCFNVSEEIDEEYEEVWYECTMREIWYGKGA